LLAATADVDIAAGVWTTAWEGQETALQHRLFWLPCRGLELTACLAGSLEFTSNVAALGVAQRALVVEFAEWTDQGHHVEAAFDGDSVPGPALVRAVNDDGRQILWKRISCSSDR
jgi:hypothetical protein